MGKSTRFFAVLACLFLGLSLGASKGAVVTYTATDVGAGPGDPWPLSTAAASSFDTAAAAIAPASLINFESAPIGSFSSLTVAPGVTITGADYLGNNQTILNSPAEPGTPPVDGFNTTLGGSEFVEVQGGTLTFSFASPTQFFGAYYTGIQSEFFSDYLTFSDGTSQTIDITNPDPSAGGVTFLGFTDAGKSITSITVDAGSPPGAGDYLGIDDVRYETPVPEPASISLLAVGAVGLLGRRRNRKLSIA